MITIAAAFIVAGAIFAFASSASSDHAGVHTANSKINAWLFLICWVLAAILVGTWGPWP